MSKILWWVVMYAVIAYLCCINSIMKFFITYFLLLTILWSIFYMSYNSGLFTGLVTLKPDKLLQMYAGTARLSRTSCEATLLFKNADLYFLFHMLSWICKRMDQLVCLLQLSLYKGTDYVLKLCWEALLMCYFISPWLLKFNIFHSLLDMYPTPHIAN
jgi:hypothetical protein